MPNSYPAKPATVGEHIKKRRMDLKLYQTELVKIFSVSEACITNWETNRSMPQIRYFPKIINFLGYFPLTFDETKFSGRLKSHRWRNGLTNKQMGKLVGVDGSTILAWENELSSPQQSQLKKVELFFKNYI